MKREEIRDAIRIGLPENLGVNKEMIINTFQNNILTDMNEETHGFFFQLKLRIGYQGFAKEFDDLYGYGNFRNMLELIHRKLSGGEGNEDGGKEIEGAKRYIMEAMEYTLQQYGGRFIQETFSGMA